MGILSDIFSGWLVPEQEKRQTGAELTKASTEAYIKKVYGKVRSQPGTIIFKVTNDVDNDDYPNDLLHIIVVWSEAVQSIDEVYLDDVPISTNSALFFSSHGNRTAFTRNFPNGMQGYNDPILTAAGWRESDLCSGKACSYIRIEFTGTDNSLQGEPELKADLTGTVSTNPADALNDLARSPIYGKGLDDTFINVSAIDKCRNICDIQVETVKGTGNYRKLFTCNIALDTGETVLDNTNTILKSMRALMPVLNGKITPIIELDESPVGDVITNDDIIKLGKVKNSSKSNRYNQVTVEYYEDSDGKGTIQQAVYPTPGSAEDDLLLAQDNGFRLDKKFRRETCRNYYEALEEAKTLLRISREQLRLPIDLPKWATIYEVGDIIVVNRPSLGWTAEVFPDYGGKPFRIETTSENRSACSFTIREHQPYIYDFFGEGNKPELPDTGLDTTGPAIPQELEVFPYYDNFKQVVVSWVGPAQRFQYQVLSESDEVLESGTVLTHQVELKGYDLGSYRFRVRAAGGLGLVSGWAETPVIMQVPSVPDSITINAENFELEVIPHLNGADSYTQFQFSISDISATEPPEPFRGPSHAYTFVGREADTEYRVWVRSYNILGQSEWIHANTRTLNESQNLKDFLGIQEIIDQLDAFDAEQIQIEIDSIKDIRPVLMQEIQTREELSAGLLENIAETGLQQLDFFNRISAGEQLIDAAVYIDPETGEIRNRAYDFSQEKFTEAEIRLSAIENSISLRVTSAFFTENAVTYSNVEQVLDSTESVISLKATQQQITDNNVVSKANAAATFIDGNQGTITSIVQGFNSDISGLNTSIYDIQQQLGENGISTQVAGLSSAQQMNYENSATMLDQIASEGLSFLEQFEQDISYALALDQVKLELDPKSVVAARLSTLDAATVSNGNLVTAATKRIEKVETDSAGNASAISAMQANVNTALGNASSSLSLVSQLDQSLDDLRASALLAVDAGGNTSLIQLDATPSVSLIKFVAGLYAFTDDQGNTKIGWNSNSGMYEFVGDIIASSFRTSTGTDFRMELFRGDYILWAGSGAMNDANAVAFIRKNGVGYFSRDFIKDPLTEEKFGRANTFTATATGHQSKGNDVKVSASVAMRLRMSTPNQLTSEPTALAYRIKRNSTIIDSGTLYCSRFEIGPGGEPGVNWITIDNVNGSIEFIDTTNSVANYNYTIEVDDYSAAGTTAYRLSISTKENLTG